MWRQHYEMAFNVGCYLASRGWKSPVGQYREDRFTYRNVLKLVKLIDQWSDNRYVHARRLELFQGVWIICP
jgi:hypothetical protein